MQDYIVIRELETTLRSRENFLSWLKRNNFACQKEFPKEGMRLRAIETQEQAIAQLRERLQLTESRLAVLEAEQPPEPSREQKERWDYLDSFEEVA